MVGDNFGGFNGLSFLDSDQGEGFLLEGMGEWYGVSF